MKELLRPKDIALGVAVSDWEQAVRATGELLVCGGYTKPCYIDAMVKAVRDLGPYIVVARGLAMPHAKSTDGVLKSGISLITLKTPIAFGNSSNDPVHILIGLAGMNDDTHIDILQAVAVLFEDDNTVPRLAAQISEESVAEIFNQSVLETHFLPIV